MSRSLRALVAVVGVLTVVGLVASHSGSAGQTLASWNDRVLGSARIEVPGAYGKGYARAVAARYSMSRPLGSSARGGLEATRKPGQDDTELRSGSQDSSGGTFGLLLPVEINGTACAVYAHPVGVPCTFNNDVAGAAVVYAAAAASGLVVKTTRGGIDLARFGSLDVVSTTASCPVGGAPVAGGLSSIFGGVVLAGMGNTERLPFPSDPGPNNSRSTTETRSGFGYDYEARLTWTKKQTATSASSELRLRMTSTGKISNDDKWELDMVLASAECGIGTDAPSGWAEVKPLTSRPGASMAKQAEVLPCTADLDGEEQEPGSDGCGPDQSLTSSVDIGGEDSPSDTDGTPPQSTRDDGYVTTEPDASSAGEELPVADPDHAVEALPTVSDVPTAPVPAGPTSTTQVGMSSPFTLRATDGGDLGTVTVERVSRTPGCSAVKLTVNTSDDPAHVKGLRPSDFRAVLAEGGTAPVSSPDGECDGGASLPASFDRADTYSGWVTFGVPAGATAVMLRPEGTAGWIFPIPTVPDRPEPVQTTTPTVVVESAETSDTDSQPDSSDKEASPAVDE